jgi:3-oxoacyl-[acyl-carrier protein] reductase
MIKHFLCIFWTSVCPRIKNDRGTDKVINVNLKGVSNCTQAVIDVMVNQGNGVIINFSSIVGLNSNIGQTNYAATKRSDWHDKDFGKGIREKRIWVNAVAPGFIMTPMTSNVPEKFLK